MANLCLYGTPKSSSFRNLIETVQLERTEFICRPCWQRTERTYRQRIREAKEQVDQDDNPPENPKQRPNSLDLLGLLRAPNTSNSCIFQHCASESSQFTELLEALPNLVIHKRKTILAAVLVKLRTGDSKARLAKIFRCGETTFQRYLIVGRNALLGDFVPLNLGFDHITREDVAQRNLLLPNNLFGNPVSTVGERKAITICDGTYVFLQKSGNYFFQRDIAITNIEIYLSLSSWFLAMDISPT